MKKLIFFLSLLCSSQSIQAAAVDKNTLNCILKTIKIETEGQSLHAKRGIVHVVHNRVKHHQEDGKRVSHCGVINAKGQFAKRPVKLTEDDYKLKDMIADVVNNRLTDITNGALFFNDRWGGCPIKGSIRTAKIDDMVFCKEANLKSKVNRKRLT